MEEQKVTDSVEQYTAKDKEDFFKSVLSDKPYSSGYELFDSQFNVKFRTLTVGESNEVFLQLRKDQNASRIGSDATYLLLLTSYRLGLSLMSINEESFQPEITKDSYTPDGDGDSYIRARAKIFEAWPVFKLSAIAEVFKSFEDKVLDLAKEVQTKDFWKADK